MYDMFIIWVEKDQIYYRSVNKFHLNILFSKCQIIMIREKRTEVEIYKRKKESKKERKHEIANYN